MSPVFVLPHHHPFGIGLLPEGFAAWTGRFGEAGA